MAHLSKAAASLPIRPIHLQRRVKIEGENQKPPQQGVMNQNFLATNSFEGPIKVGVVTNAQSRRTGSSLTGLHSVPCRQLNLKMQKEKHQSHHQVDVTAEITSNFPFREQYACASIDRWRRGTSLEVPDLSNNVCTCTTFLRINATPFIHKQCCQLTRLNEGGVYLSPSFSE